MKPSEIVKGMKVTLAKWKEIGFSAPPRMYLHSWTYKWTVLRDQDHPMDHIGDVVIAMDMNGTFKRWEKPEDVQIGWPDEEQE